MKSQPLRRFKLGRSLSAIDHLDPVLHALLCESEPFREAQALSKEGPTVPRRISFGIGREYLRLAGHNRSLCRILEPASRRTIFDSAALIIKGTEPLAVDAKKHLKRLCKQSRDAELSSAEHLTFIERKTPLALTHAEASAEFLAGIRVHNKHWQTYGFQADMPVPLFVHRFDEHHTVNIARLLKSALPQLVFETCAESSKFEFGCITFFSDHVPTRILSPYNDYLKHTRKFLPDEEVEDRLVSLFARILVLGELPWTPLNDTTGSCFDPKNATHRGGVCDLDSLVPFELSPSKAFFNRSLCVSMHRLFATLRFHNGILSTPSLKQTEQWKCKLESALNTSYKLARSRHRIHRKTLERIRNEIAAIKICL